MEEFKFKKKFGQNFLQNKAVIDKIAKVALVKPGSLIIEVGPGSGNLTVALAELHKDSNILAYEIDNNLEDILSVRLKDYNNVKVLFSDFLKADIALDVKEYSYNNIYFVSNVPYYITTPILFKLIDSNLAFEKIVMMVQKEVGDRFCSKVSTKDYGALTVILNYFFDVRKEFVVDRNQSGNKNLLNIGVQPYSLLSLNEDLLNIALKNNIITSDQKDMLVQYMEDPDGTMRNFIKTHPTFIDDVINNSDNAKSVKRAKLCKEKNWYGDPIG